MEMLPFEFWTIGTSIVDGNVVMSVGAFRAENGYLYSVPVSYEFFRNNWSKEYAMVRHVNKIANKRKRNLFNHKVEYFDFMEMTRRGIQDKTKFFQTDDGQECGVNPQFSMYTITN